MPYFEGFVIPVPIGNKDAFTRHAGKAAPLFKDFGATRVVDAWGDDVPDGKINDFKTAVQARDGETVGFGWIEYPDRETRDAASERMMSDPRMQQLGDMPFDGRRMIFGGFAPLVDRGVSDGAGYVDGFVLPVPSANREAYRDVAEKACEVFMEHGVTRYVEAWGDDVPTGQITDYFRAAHAQDGETIVFSWCEWPDKAARDAGWKAIMEDERLKNAPEMPFDGKRMIYGGFAIVSQA